MEGKGEENALIFILFKKGDEAEKNEEAHF